ncbi:hypothetical protein [Paenibacillus contaminans]|uniref:Cellobiose phosphorylase n=1 Tax=Paenibacillus contaminans TaxID=450362 RepID=A0A329MTA1_9BACL|nr:hypothetical protein [Paenibacillus contaminans]RAV23141.1 hypothetical protein DQG23_02800 [Paenibacillus contaminans]
MKSINIVWIKGPAEGRIEVMNGSLLKVRVKSGDGHAEGESWNSTGDGPLTLELTIDMLPSNGGTGGESKGKTLVSVVDCLHPFSFFIEDVHTAYPIYIPEFGVAVTAAEDLRSYEELQADIERRRLRTNLQKIADEPEESFEAASAATKNQPCPIWQGIGRDTRIFEFQVRGRPSNNFWSPPLGGSELQWDWVQPRQHGKEAGLPENDGRPVRYYYMTGRGMGCTDGISRRLEDGVLPILHTTIEDDEIVYKAVSFVSCETRALVKENVDGTHYLIADGQGFGHMFTEAQALERERLLQEKGEQGETTVYYCQITAENTGAVPRYAWFKNIIPNGGLIPYSFDGTAGFGQYNPDRVFGVSKLNGKPLHAEETAVLIMPGERASFEFYLPHEPISHERALKLIGQDFQARHEECRAFWKGKLSGGAQIRLPEPRIEEMLQAGLLHTDMIFYGNEPQGTLVPAIGIYTAIGSESSPIIQFMNAMGRDDTAKRGLSFFLDKQHENGFMQNFGGYMLETGAALWCIGEYYRYTRDADWIREIAPKLLKAYEYLMNWRKRNETESLRGRGYGMLEGKTADPEDPFHSFMLSGYAYIGLSRLAEMMADIDAGLAGQIRGDAEGLKADIRTSFDEAASRSPVVPLGDGTWVPTAPPWTEHRGPLSLYAEGGNWYTHGSFMSRDSILGPMYLIFQEVIDPREQAADHLLNYHNELMYTRNVAFSQPYYSMHPWVHLKRGEVKPFLKAYYNTFAGLADRETYTFWEHYYQVSPHKTHEEGWFLMQTRWMLYMEEGSALKLLPGIPRKWLEQGKRIELQDVCSYFGAFTLRVTSEGGRLSASIVCDPKRGPETVLLRLPHPEGKRASRLSGGGVYLPEEECVRLDHFDGAAEVELFFD